MRRARRVAPDVPVNVIVIGTHGGAGTSTLVSMLDPSGSGRVIEWRPGMREGHDRIPLLVARSTALGLKAASEWVSRWRRDLRRPALAVVADAPLGTPRIVRYRIRALERQVLAVVTVPYVYELRQSDDVDHVRDRPAVARASQQLQQRVAALAPLSARDEQVRETMAPVPPVIGQVVAATQ